MIPVYERKCLVGELELLTCHEVYWRITAIHLHHSGVFFVSGNYRKYSIVPSTGNSTKSTDVTIVVSLALHVIQSTFSLILQYPS